MNILEDYDSFSIVEINIKLYNSYCKYSLTYFSAATFR